MKLPFADRAIVPERKVTAYLLSATHPTGRHKAAWLTKYGFAVEGWEALAGALKRHADMHEVVRTEDSLFGMRYVIEGPLETPDGRNPRARSVWFMESGESVPHFVTMYPLRRDAP